MSDMSNRLARWFLCALIMLGVARSAIAQTAAPDAAAAAPVNAAHSMATAPTAATAPANAVPAPVPGNVFANNATKPVAGPSFAPMGYALALILALIAAAVWLLRRSGLAPGSRSSRMLSLVGQLPIGPRERVVVVEIENRWLVLGISPSGMTRLASLAKGSAGSSASAPASGAEDSLQIPSPFAALVERLRRNGS